MDLRDNAHDQLVTHIATLRFMAEQETPAQLIWAEMQRILSESATHIELFVIPKVEPVKQHLDLLHRNPEPTIAQYVPATSEAARDEDEREGAVPGFMRSNGKVTA